MSNTVPHRVPRATTPPPPSFPFDRYRRLRYPSGRPSHCPHCQEQQIHRWGTFSGRQRYRCVACRRTFSDFTGTPLAHLKRVDRWLAFCHCVLTTRTVRGTAAEIGVHKNTAFRWRHLLLSGLVATDDALFGRSLLIHETWFPHSEKGSRNLRRAPRRRSTGYRIDVRHAWVLIARDDVGRVASRVVGSVRPRVEDLRPLLPRLESTTELLSRFGSWGATGLLAERTGRSYRRVDRRSPELRRVRRYIMALRRWLRRFRGVATRYLDNYLVWHRLLDLLGENRTFATGRAILLAGRFP